MAVGGDGTVHQALQAVVGTDTALGIVPLGTGNDAANSVGLARASPEAAVSVVLAGTRRAFDVGRIEAADGTIRHFLCVMSSGFDSSANERANQMTWPSGTALYIRVDARGAAHVPADPVPGGAGRRGGGRRRDDRVRWATVRRSAAGCWSAPVPTCTTASWT